MFFNILQYNFIMSKQMKTQEHQETQQKIFLTDPKSAQQNYQQQQSTNSYKNGQWESFNKALSKNRAKAKKLKFQIKYRQFINRKKNLNGQGAQNNAKNRNLLMPSIRSLVSQKHKEQDQLRKTISEYNYHLSEKERTMRAFKIAAQKYKKIISVREKHYKERIQLSQYKSINQQQINCEKQRLLSLNRSDKYTKYKSLEKSRIHKLSLAQEVRRQSQLNRIRVSQYQKGKKENLKQRYYTQKSQQKMATLKSLQVIEVKKFEAEKIRNGRIHYQMRERDFIHNQRVSFHKKASKKISFMKTITDGLTKKIEQYRIFSKEVYPGRRNRNRSLPMSVNN